MLASKMLLCSSRVLVSVLIFARILSQLVRKMLNEDKLTTNVR
jgi:hypothetical protein